MSFIEDLEYCVKLVSQKRAYSQAKKFCEKEGGHLAEPDSDRKVKQLFESIKNKDWGSGWYAFIGSDN